VGKANERLIIYGGAKSSKPKDHDVIKAKQSKDNDVVSGK
jgi:hypothetical protein